MMKLGFKGTMLAAMVVIGCGAANAASPQLRLDQSAIGPISIAQGQAGAAQVVHAGNIGGGTLNLTVKSSASWLAPTVGASGSCAAFQTCLPVNIALQTSSLTAGSYTGTVTVNDPNAIDAPQTITVTIQVGTAVPANLTLYAPPGGKVTSNFATASAVQSQSSAPWLSVGLSSKGTYQFAVPYTLTADATGLTANDYNGTVKLTGSSSAADNATVSVLLHVTSSPIAAPSPTAVNFRLAANSISQTQIVNVANAGQGTLQVSGATASAGNGTWLTATASGNAIKLVANSTGVAAGSYSGTVTVTSNAANNSITIPVQFQVDAAGGPVAGFQAAVNNATFVPGEAVAPGDIMAIFGDQFFFSEPNLASTLPLPTQLAGVNGSTSTVQVLVNGQAAPLYYASYGQLDFQLPFNLTNGQAVVQVVRDGQAGNSIAVQVSAAEPRILPFSFNNYGIVQNATQGGYAVSPEAGAALGLTAHPAIAGTDYLTIYCIGLGPVSPAVATGAAAGGAGNLSTTTLPTSVTFSSGNPLGLSATVKPSFSGLAPNFVGLYQVNVQVPATSPKGKAVPMSITAGGVTSNSVNVAIQ